MRSKQCKKFVVSKCSRLLDPRDVAQGLYNIGPSAGCSSGVLQQLGMPIQSRKIEKTPKISRKMNMNRNTCTEKYVLIEKKSSIHSTWDVGYHTPRNLVQNTSRGRVRLQTITIASLIFSWRLRAKLRYYLHWTNNFRQLPIPK